MNRRRTRRTSDELMVGFTTLNLNSMISFSEAKEHKNSDINIICELWIVVKIAKYEEITVVTANCFASSNHGFICARRTSENVFYPTLTLTTTTTLMDETIG